MVKRFSQEILKVKVSTTGQVDLIYTPVDGTAGSPQLPPPPIRLLPWPATRGEAAEEGTPWRRRI